MNAAPKIRQPIVDLSKKVGSDFHIVCRMFGGVTGPEAIVLVRERYYRVGQFTLDQWRMRGVPDDDDLGLLEVDPDGEPIDEDRSASAADASYQSRMEQI